MSYTSEQLRRDRQAIGWSRRKAAQEIDASQRYYRDCEDGNRPVPEAWQAFFGPLAELHRQARPPTWRGETGDNTRSARDRLRLCRAREAIGWTRRAAARWIGCHPTLWSEAERGERGIHDAWIDALLPLAAGHRAIKRPDWRVR